MPPAKKTGKAKTKSAAKKPAKKKPQANAAAPPKKPPPTPKIASGAGDSHRDREAARSRENSTKTREVGPLDPVVNPERRARGKASLRSFSEEYFPQRFPLPFAEPHDTAIDRMERCTDRGGMFACALPRGMGKTTMAEVAVIRAVCYGLRRFVVLILATAALARRRLKAILREFETNDRLREDFPEVCQLIRALERIHNRTAGQTCDGNPTRIEMTKDSLILPTVEGAASSGAIIMVASMEGAIRGLNVSGPDGEVLRPDLIVLDDVQTRESARSPIQTSERENTITDDVLGLAGPNVQIAAVMLCTVILPGDLSDRFLSGERHPEWAPVRTKMLESFPERMDLWDQYAEVRRESLRSGDEGKRANEFYSSHRAEMDAGGRVSWPERKRPGEISGLQSAMNLYFSNPRGFRAEMQNEPDPEGGAVAAKQLKPDLVVSRLSGLARFEVPREATRITAMIDVGSGLLWYAIAAFDDSFSGSILDYGSWPRQARAVFEANDPRPSLQQHYGGDLSESQWVYQGLVDLTADVLGRVYQREATGEQLRIDRCLVDCGWNSAAVYQFVRASPHFGVLYPSKGIGRTTTSRGVSEWKPRPGERSGWHWRLTMSETGKGRMVQFDPDAWKTALYERLTTPLGGRGCLTLYGRDASAHELLGYHLAAEAAEPVTLRGATFDKWTVAPHRPDNHLLDCVVGCLVAASVQGLTWVPSADAPKPAPAKKRLTLAEKMKLHEARERQAPILPPL